MKQYVDKGQVFECEGLTVPNRDGNRFFQKMMEEVNSGKAEIIQEEKPDKSKTDDIRSAIGLHIDQQARSTGPFGFDNIISAVSYADDTEDTVNQPYGAALKDWRRECWNKAREILAAWQGGGAEPTLEEVISQLPVFVEPQ